MALPSLLLLFAVLAAAVLAYGTDASWASVHHGIQIITWSRRLQWPMVFTALILCMIVVALVIAGRRRVWWLIGLLPVLVLFVHRFLTGPLAGARVVENPPGVDATAATFLHDTDSVVGVHVGDAAFAYPCSLLNDTPAVVQNQRQTRFIVMWSPLANLATASTVGRDLAARDLDIASIPAGALLLYDGRLGQFINGLTGQTLHDQKPLEFHQPLETTITSWAQWRQQNPTTLVMAPQAARAALWPHRLDWWQYPPPDPAGDAAAATPRRVCLIRTTPPIAVPIDSVSDVPLNLSVGNVAVVVLRDLSTGEVRAFDRYVESDLIPRFAGATGASQANAAMIDTDTATQWTSAGASLATTGTTKGKTLRPIPVAQNVDLSVLKFWFPGLQLIQGSALTAAIQAAPPPSVAAGTRSRSPQQQQSNRRRRRRANAQQ